MHQTTDTNSSVQSMSESVKSKKSPKSILIGLAGILIIGLFAFYLGTMTEKSRYMNSQTSSNIEQQNNAFINPSIDQNQIEESSTNVFLINNTCDKSGCLFEDRKGDTVIGFASLEGYYQTYDKKDWGDVDTTCTAFLVKQGNKDLIDNFIKLVKIGNTVNKTNEEGELILNVDLKSIDDNYRKQIESSTESSPVKIDVIRKFSLGRGVPGCASLVDIVAVR